MNLKGIGIRCFVGLLNLIYAFIRPRRALNKVTLLSRQSDSPSMDFRMLEAALEERGVTAVTLSRKLEGSLGNKISYFFHMFGQMKHIASSKAVIVDSYCIPVSVLRHKPELKVMQIWHASCAIKQFGLQRVGKEDGSDEVTAKGMHMHENYDYVACCSDITAEHFMKGFGVTRDKIVKLGLPRLDYILKTAPLKKDHLTRVYPELLNGKKNVVYVPTFRRNREVKVMDLAEALDFNRYNLIVKLHPKDREATGNVEKEGVIYIDSVNTYDLLSVCDIIVSDYSAFCVESTLAGKPLFMYTYDIDEYREKNGLNVEYSDEPIGKYAFRDAAELAGALEAEYDYEALASFRDRYIDIDTENCTGRMADFIIENMKRGRR